MVKVGIQVMESGKSIDTPFVLVNIISPFLYEEIKQNHEIK